MVPDPPQEAVEAIVRVVLTEDLVSRGFWTADGSGEARAFLAELRRSDAIRYASEVEALEARLEEAIALVRDERKLLFNEGHRGDDHDSPFSQSECWKCARSRRLVAFLASRVQNTEGTE